MTSLEDMLAHEAQSMSRAVAYIEHFSTTVPTGEGPRPLTLLLYSCAPVTHGEYTQVEDRWAIYIGGKQVAGGIV